MDTLNHDIAGRASRRERFVIVAAGLLALSLIVWGMTEWHLIRFSLVVGAFSASIVAVVLAAAWRRGLAWLITRSALRFYLWLALGSLSVVVLFYTAERWRGKRAWAALAAEAAASGESLELSAVIPPPVPDDLNFADAPGVADALWFNDNIPANRPVQEATRFYHGDASSWPRASWTLGQSTDLSRWAGFLASLVPETVSNQLASAATQEPTNAGSAVLRALARYEPAFAALRAAAARPRARYPIEYEAGWTALTGRGYCILTSLRQAAHLLSLRASAQVALGESDNALRDIMLALRLADTLQLEPFASAHHARREMIVFAVHPVWEGFAAHSWSPSQIEELRQRFAAMDPIRHSERQFRGETFLLMDFAAQLQSCLEGGNPALARKLSQETGSEAVAVRLFYWFYPSGWLAQDRVWFYRFYQRCSPGDPMDRLDRLDGNLWRREFRAIHDPFMFLFAFPRALHVAEESAEAGLHLQTVCSQVLAACALEDYRVANSGQYPAALEDLPGYQSAPFLTDHLTDRRMMYRRTQSGGFVLYSVGLNRVDDGGEPSELNHPPFPELRKGDWVWASAAERHGGFRDSAD